MKNSFPTKRYPRMWLERLRHNLGGCPALMSVRLGTKKRARRATLCTNDANLRKNNIAVLQGTSSQRYGRSVFDCGGVRSIDFDGNEEAGIDGNEIAKMFFNVNPHMAWSFRTIGARGQTSGSLPMANARRKPSYTMQMCRRCRFQSGPGYQILQGRHQVAFRIAFR